MLCPLLLQCVRTAQAQDKPSHMLWPVMPEVSSIADGMELNPGAEVILDENWDTIVRVVRSMMKAATEEMTVLDACWIDTIDRASE